MKGNDAIFLTIAKPIPDLPPVTNAIPLRLLEVAAVYAAVVVKKLIMIMILMKMMRGQKEEKDRQPLLIGLNDGTVVTNDG